MRRTNHRNLVNVGILSGGYRSFPCSVHRRRRASEFSACGQGTGISQSSVSARVKALEDNLGVLLFERHARAFG